MHIFLCTFVFISLHRPIPPNPIPNYIPYPNCLKTLSNKGVMSISVQKTHPKYLFFKTKFFLAQVLLIILCCKLSANKTKIESLYLNTKHYPMLKGCRQAHKKKKIRFIRDDYILIKSFKEKEIQKDGAHSYNRR